MYRAFRITTLLVAAAAFVGCAGGPQPGDVELQLTAASQMQLLSLPAQPDTEPGDHDIMHALVIINEIDAKVNGVWTPLTTTHQTVDLLALDNTKVSSLGIVTIPPGQVSELRFILDEHNATVVLKSGAIQPLEIPDHGVVKVDGKLDLDACTTGLVILDFDPKITIEHECNKPTEYELGCRAHIKTEEVKGGCGGGGNGGGGGGTGGGGGNGGGTPDMAGGGDMASICDVVVCRMGQICVVQNGLPACLDTCTSLVCTPPDVCAVVAGTPTCVNPGH